MKLFNTKINLNFIKNSAKFLILAFLIIYCIYILYFSSLQTVESFANTYDCSKCEVKPTSGNCIKIYDFSYSIIPDNTLGRELTISFEKIDTSYIFCPWEPNCNISNMIDQDKRSGISNQELSANMYSGLNNVTCCSGSDFYAAETKNYYSVFDNFNKYHDITAMCDQFDIELSNNYGVYNKLTEEEIRRYYNNNAVVKTNFVLRQDNYYKVKNFCLNHNPSHTNYNEARSSIDDFKGILFKRDISSTGHVLQDPRLRKPGLTRKTIIDNIISKQQLIDISDDAIKEEKYDSVTKQPQPTMKTDYDYIENGVTIDVSNSFYQVIDKHNKRLNALKTQNMSDADFEQTLKNILYDLVAHYNLAPSNYNNNNDNFYEIFKYTPSKTLNSTPGSNIPAIDIKNTLPSYSKIYILDENEFLNCFGEIQSVPDLSMNFTVSGEYYGDFFGLSDPNLTTFEQASSNNYGPSAELEMELRRLQNVTPGGNAPVGVINQYLNAINGFYERQISNMMGPKTHTLNNQLVFENDNLEIKTPTFFKYETDPNNKYECQPSITGNDKFKDCGPTAYYTEFKP